MSLILESRRLTPDVPTRVARAGRAEPAHKEGESRRNIVWPTSPSIPSKLHNAVALAEAGRAGEVRYLGEFENTPAATAKLVRKLDGEARGARQACCYEAGPTGYGLHRQIRQLGQDCIVVAPSLIPRKPGKRVKTNRLDALSLVKQLRAGKLTAVWVPDERHEAVREPQRGHAARRRSSCERSASRCHRCCCGSAGTPRARRPGARRTWPAARRAEAGDPRATHCVLEERLVAVRQAKERIERLEQAIGEAVPAWSAGAAGNGADGVTRGRLHRGDDAAERDRRSEPLPHAARADGLARSGAERVLHRRRHHDAARSPRRATGVVRAAPDRMRLELSASATGRRRASWSGLPPRRRWCATLRGRRRCARLTGRYRALCRAGKPDVVAVTAVARELAGFISVAGPSRVRLPPAPRRPLPMPWPNGCRQRSRHIVT